ncbi:MAG: hypothetical protein ACQET7_00590 [Thermodesulfobacteriota bacterium]
MKPIRWQVLLCLLAVLVAAGGCGKKGDPSVPGKGFSAEVRELSGAWDGGFIVLWGDLAGISGGQEAVERMQGARVYYAAYDPAEPPCEGCPVRYEGYHEFGVETITEEGFYCKIPGKRKDALYYFKVHLIGPEGARGPASERVRVDRLES